MRLSILIITLSLLSLFLSSCAKPKALEIENPALSYIDIYLEDGVKNHERYRVYINYKEESQDLKNNALTTYNVEVGKVNIQVVRGRKTASIDMEVVASKHYRLRLFRDESSAMALLQIPSNNGR